MSQQYTILTNCQICRNGTLISGERLVVSNVTGSLEQDTGLLDGEVVDLDGAIVAPGFLELQTNGLRGFHFTHFEDGESYGKKLQEVAKYLPQTGVTAFYATIPTVHSNEFKKVGAPSIDP